MEFQPEIIGPAIHARKFACRPGEPLLWAAFTRRHYFAVPELSASGGPRDGGLKRAALGAADFLTSYTPGVFDPGPDRPPPPDVVVHGPSAECAAVSLMSPFVREKLIPGEGLPRHLWALTPDRLRLLGPTPAAAESGSTFGRFGKGLLDAVSSKSTKPAVAALDDLVPVFDIPRGDIAGFALADGPCVRLSFVDGSGLDFVFGGMDREACERMLALTFGGA
jgi:hypothetical protein